jgi:hypothetical protein
MELRVREGLLKKTSEQGFVKWIGVLSRESCGRHSIQNQQHRQKHSVWGASNRAFAVAGAPGVRRAGRRVGLRKSWKGGS